MSNRLFKMTVVTFTGLYDQRRKWERGPPLGLSPPTRISTHSPEGLRITVHPTGDCFDYCAIVCMVTSHPWLLGAIGVLGQEYVRASRNSHKNEAGQLS